MSLILRVEHLNENDFNKIYVISDLHGYSDLLDKALNQINLSMDDLLIVAGDSCDRGKDTLSIYEKLMGLRERYSVIHLLGNHEWMFYNYIADQIGYELWMINGGDKTLDSYDRHLTLMDSHINYIKSMPTVIETQKHLITHSGVNPDIPIEMESLNSCLWYSEEDLTRFDNKKMLISGHHITRSGEIEFRENNRICIDCGSYMRQKLGIIELKTYKTMYVS